MDQPNILPVPAKRVQKLGFARAKAEARRCRQARSDLDDGGVKHLGKRFDEAHRIDPSTAGKKAVPVILSVLL
ncbi:hypothetical protein [Burkholderia sp. SRS-W-2-2016]|uniref:hypothetical protein n=1 Tax=Burkholderia sp. SRS-W-2-2016 TaxID=1926878 RepID=UPI00117D366A|nr:hypothetical protein [Burkholderia sp. SRS-W-2-2016]